MSYLSDYDHRTAWKYEPIRGTFHTAPGLALKATPEGAYVPFRGTTVVFRMNRQDQHIIRLMQDILYHHLNADSRQPILMPVLREETFHLTLHDLVCPTLCVSDLRDEAGYRHELSDSFVRAGRITEAIRRDFAGRSVTLVADRIVNMVSTSLVLLLRPASEEDFDLLMDVYRRFDDIVPLPYPFTPHITLAYYRPGLLDGEALNQAVEAAQITEHNAPVFTFPIHAITPQLFRDMQIYLDVPQRVCLLCDGGMNRSVMAAQILNRLALERGLPLQAEARAALPGTEGTPIPDEVFRTLAGFGFSLEDLDSVARTFRREEATAFSHLLPISSGALQLVLLTATQSERMNQDHLLFMGVPDPQFGEVSYETAFQQLARHAETYLARYQAVLRAALEGL